MPQACIGKDSSLDQIPNLSNVINELLRARTDTTLILDTSWRVTVEIFGSDGDADYAGAEFFAEVVDCELESGLFILLAWYANMESRECTDKLKIKSLLSSTTPETKQKRSVGVHCSLNSRDQVSSSTGLNHGKETSGCESSISASEFLCGIELICEVLLCARRSIEVQVSLSYHQHPPHRKYAGLPT